MPNERFPVEKPAVLKASTPGSHPVIRSRRAGLPLLAKRDVVDTLMTVTILPAGKGVTFVPEQVRIEWRTP